MAPTITAAAQAMVAVLDLATFIEVSTVSGLDWEMGACGELRG